MQIQPSDQMQKAAWKRKLTQFPSLDKASLCLLVRAEKEERQESVWEDLLNLI